MNIFEQTNSNLQSLDRTYVNLGITIDDYAILTYSNSKFTITCENAIGSYLTIEIIEPLSDTSLTICDTDLNDKIEATGRRIYSLLNKSITTNDADDIADCLYKINDLIIDKIKQLLQSEAAFLLHFEQR